MKKYIIRLMTIFLLGSQCFAANYKIDPSSSKITFSGTSSGAAFTGTFEKWESFIHFDPSDLINTKVNVTIDMASAKTGNSMYDGTLPTADWFDVNAHPKAYFDSTGITKNSDGSYTMEGALRIRDKTSIVSFKFSLQPADLSKFPIKTTFTLNVDRTKFDIGIKSDAKGEWVSRDIKIDVTLSANPQ